MVNLYLSDRILSGDKRAAARMITLVENNDPEALDELKKLYKFTGRAHIVGVTGPPGAGKSTVTDKVVSFFLNQGKKIGIIAVDPTSPFTGGAILGDRVRMQDLATNPNVFIRSMGTRGHLGGVARATSSAVRILDAFGCDIIFVETVGVGQSEIDIVKIADTTIIVMVPGLGDDIQAIKAGIMEVGDIFVVNKSDKDGADRVVNEINMALDFITSDRRPPVIKTTATTGDGIDKLGDSILSHMEYLTQTNKLLDKRKNNSKSEIMEIVKYSIIERISRNGRSQIIDEFSEKAALREMDPYTACEMIIKGDVYNGW